MKHQNAYSKISQVLQGNCDVKSVSEKRISSIREASMQRKDSLQHNFSSLNRDSLVAHKNCLSTYTSKTLIGI